MITCNSSNLQNMDKATPTNYRLIFPLIPTETSIAANNPFIMNIFSAILPSVSMATEDLSWQGNKTKRGLIPMEFDVWLVSFVVDSRLQNWALLFKWMSYINNNWNKIAEEHNNYGVDAALVVTDNFNNVVMEVLFVDIWPSMIGEVSFSQREGDVVLESTVNFNYDYFKIRYTGWTDNPIFGFSSSSSSSSVSSSSSSSSSLSSSSSSSSVSSSSSSSLSSSSSESISVSAGYTQTLGPGYWTTNEGTWTGTLYESQWLGSDRINLFITGGAAWVGLTRPTKIRITFDNFTNSPLLNFFVRDTLNNLMVEEYDTPITDGVPIEFDVTDTGEDINEIHAIEGGANPFEIINIEIL